MARYWLVVVFVLLEVQGYLALSDKQHKEPDEICMKYLECFKIDEDFKKRPFNQLPDDRYKIGTKYRLYTKKNPHEPAHLSLDDVETINKAPFKENQKIRIIVHGYMDDTLYGKWMERMRDAFFIGDIDNIILVDWHEGSKKLYSKAIANARVVGAEIAHLMKQIEKLRGIKAENFHIIGHGVGAHIAGYAGERVPHLGRITGLDPIGMYFEGMPPRVRLDESDADFVDVIHTDISAVILGQLAGLGMKQQSGHVDFYPNNGQRQPGCQTPTLKKLIVDGLVDVTKTFIVCNHLRAVDYFIQTINYKALQPVSYSCLDWEKFTEGKCASCGKTGTLCAPMGFYADTYKPPTKDTTLKMYVKTGGSEPFWVREYQVSVELSKPENSKTQYGLMKLTVNGDHNNQTFDLGTYQNLVPGAQFKYLISTDEDLGAIKNVDLKWKYNALDLLFKRTIFVNKIHIKPLVSASDWINLKAEAFCLVEEKDTPLLSGSSHKFDKNSCAN